MRAIVLAAPGGPDILAVSDVPVPEPGEGQVQVKVAYAAMNPLDVLVRAGRFRFHPPLPFVLGYQYSGRIAKVGAGVDPARIGQRVSVSSQWGGYAEVAVTPASAAAPIPEAFDWKLGTVAMGPSLTAWHLVHTVARMRAGDVAVVHAAAGAVGLMLTQIAKDAGATVIGLVGGAAKLAWARQFGADLLLDYRADADWPKRVKGFTGAHAPGPGADFIFDGNQGPETPKNFQALAPLGQAIFIGAMAGPAPEVAIPALIAGSHGVRGFVVNHGMAVTKGGEFKDVVPKLASGQWKFPIAAPVPLEKVADLHRAVEARTLLGRGIVAVGGEI
jgi:NADPH2:quinone reductase